MTTIIIENEIAAKDLLISLIKDYKPEIQVVGIASTIHEAIQLFKNVNPELAFIDIELDDGQSFEILNQVDLSECKLIFTTAYDNYALKAFEYNALDYLLKPFSPKQFVKSVNKALANRQKRLDYQSLFKYLQRNGFDQELSQRISVSSEKGIRLLETSNIIHIEGDKGYCFIHLSDGDQVMASKSLSHYVENLDSRKFIRTHQSHLVNLDFVMEFSFEDGGYLRMKNNKHIPVSRRKKAEVIQILKQ